MNIANLIAQELTVAEKQVSSAIALLDEGATVPFIARYRKEATQGLDDTQLRHLEERLIYLRELEERRQTVLKSIDEQGKLSDELKAQIEQTQSKTELEDLYLPYKPKRRTKAQIAREAGLEPLALGLLQDPTLSPENEAEKFINAEHSINSVQDALDGAKQILMENFAEQAAVVSELREWLWQKGWLCTEVMPGKENEGEKFKDYFVYAEPINKIPSHRALAIFRGRNEGILQANLKTCSPDAEEDHTPAQDIIAKHIGWNDQNRAADSWLKQCVAWAWKIKLFTKLDLDIKNRLREQAEEEAINVFALNLRDLLMAAPAGSKAILGLDPGLRTGVKVAAVDTTGKLLDTATIYPHAPQKQWEQSLATLAKICKQHNIDLVSIGNGTASRETEKLTADLIKQHPELKLNKIVVSEAGASVYSASEFAAKEFPELDVSLRGAVSIARRLQDPLAELVKIDPKSIGVGQYQHDVSQTHLARSLNTTVEDCVNAVGVDLNTASVPLLTQVSGLNKTIAENIVSYRDENGRFKERKELGKVPRLGAKTFEQAAGFLRITDGSNALDASAVHPEAYPIVEKILKHTGNNVAELMGNASLLKSLNASDFIDEQFGVPTVVDIFKELEKPGRDPRPEFKTAEFKEGIETIADLKPGMKLQGVVSNVTNFGAFVDIGVHQDGLVHISELADKFVKDPRDVVKTGDVVQVTVMDVDAKRKRISLSCKSQPGANATTEKKPVKEKTPNKQKSKTRQGTQGNAAVNNAMAAAFANAKNR